MAETMDYLRKDRQSARLPILREALWGIDWLSLKTSAVYYGCGVPRGDGSAVVLVPGFMGTDISLTELYFWLWRIGYKPFMSGIGRNADCLDKLSSRLASTVKNAHEKTGKPVHLIGHSLGGILARSVANRLKKNVASVTALGSPFRGIRSHRVVLRQADKVRARILRENKNEQPDCFTGFCECEAVSGWASKFPAEIRQTAVYTKTDGIVDWRVCVDTDPANNYEVSGTHVGLIVNPQVYRIVGHRLADG